MPTDLWRPGCLAPTLENKRFFLPDDRHVDADVHVGVDVNVNTGVDVDANR